jgi:pilus assembly protein Flp/PilA
LNQRRWSFVSSEAKRRALRIHCGVAAIPTVPKGGVLLKAIVQRFRSIGKRDDGASAVEYGLLVALIAVVIAVTVALLGTALKGKFEDAKDCVSSKGICAPAQP